MAEFSSKVPKAGDAFRLLVLVAGLCKQMLMPQLDFASKLSADDDGACHWPV